MLRYHDCLMQSFSFNIILVLQWIKRNIQLHGDGHDGITFLTLEILLMQVIVYV